MQSALEGDNQTFTNKVVAQLHNLIGGSQQGPRAPKASGMNTSVEGFIEHKSNKFVNAIKGKIKVKCRFRSTLPSSRRIGCLSG